MKAEKFKLHYLNLNQRYTPRICRLREKPAKVGTIMVSNLLNPRKAAYAAANAAESKKGRETLVLDVRKITLIADYFVITGGDSANQIRAIVEAIDSTLIELGAGRAIIEGKQEGRWALLDYGDVIVHVLHAKERDLYKLEQFWNQALIVPSEEWKMSDKP